MGITAMAMKTIPPARLPQREYVPASISVHINASLI